MNLKRFLASESGEVSYRTKGGEGRHSFWHKHPMLTGVPDWNASLGRGIFGSFFICVLACFTIWASLSGKIPELPNHSKQILEISLLLCGVYVLAIGIRRFSFAFFQRRPKGGPWDSDFFGAGTVFVDNQGVQLVNFLMALQFTAAILWLINHHLLLINGKILWSPPGIVVLALNIVWLFKLGTFLYRGLRYLKYGSPKLEISSFPLYLGESAKFTFMNLPENLQTLNVTLRCVGKYCYETGTGKDRRTYYEYYELYKLEEVLKLDGNHLSLPFAEWHLPKSEMYTTKQSYTDESVYWHLQARARVSGIDYAANFILPIYWSDEAHKRSRSAS